MKIDQDGSDEVKKSKSDIKGHIHIFKINIYMLVLKIGCAYLTMPKYKVQRYV